MSLSPVYPRPHLSLSTSRESLRHEQDLINSYEYEEERISNTLSRKLEQLKREKIQLENTHEAESEAQVNRLTRQISSLRLAQQQSMQAESSAQGSSSRNQASSSNGVVSQSTPPGRPPNVGVSTEPNTAAILEALRRENDSLRRRLMDTERDYSRVVRLNDIYREELIQHRRRLGIPHDSLIGLSGPSLTNSPSESFTQPNHLRNAYSFQVGHPTSFGDSSPEPGRPSSPPNRATGATPIPINPQPVAPLAAITTTGAPAPMGVPIPRSSSSRLQRDAPPRRHTVILSSTSSSSASTEPSATTSPSSSVPASPFTFSPPVHTNGFSNRSHGAGGHAPIYGRNRSSSDAWSMYNDQDMGMSVGTQMTTPPSSNPSPFFPFHLPVIHQQVPLAIPNATNGLVARINQLTYPTAPPPSLSSSLGQVSPVMSRRNSVGVNSRPSIPPSPRINSSEPVAEEEAEELSLSVGRRSSGSASASTEGNVDDDDTFADSISTATGAPSTNAVGFGSRTAAGRASPPQVTEVTATRRSAYERGARIAETGSLAPGRRRHGNETERGRWRRGGR